MKTTLRDTPLEPTRMGYSLKSQDRLWVVFSFDDDADEDSPWHGERIYPLNRPGESVRFWGYELLDDDTIFYTSRREAEEAASHLRTSERAMYVLNVGDDARAENAYLNDGQLLTHGKYRGSDAALVELARRWKERRDA